MKFSSQALGPLIFSVLLGGAGPAHAQLVGPGGAGLPPPPTPPSYGAYVVGYYGLDGAVATQLFQQGVLPNFNYLGQSPVNLAAGAGGGQYGGITAYADVSSGDIGIVSSSVAVDLPTGVIGQLPPQPHTLAIALFYSQVTFHGNGNGLLEVDGTLHESGQARVDQYVNVSPSVLLPWGGYSAASEVTPGNWSSGLRFSYYDGEKAYVVVQLSAWTDSAGSVTVYDPVTLELSPGTSFTAAAPNFLASAAVPEPATWALFLFGGAGLGVASRSARPRRAPI